MREAALLTSLPGKAWYVANVLEAVLKAGCRVKNACIIELFMSYRGFEDYF